MTIAPRHAATRSPRLSSTTTVLILLCVMYAITYIDRVNVSTAASVFKKDLHLTNAQVGLVFSAFAYPYLILQIIGGWISDRFGARLTLTVSAIIWALQPCSRDWWAALPPCSLLGSCSGWEKAPLFPPQREQCLTGRRQENAGSLRALPIPVPDWAMRLRPL